MVKLTTDDEILSGTKTELKPREYTTTLGQVMKHFREQILGFTVPEMSRKIDIPATTIYNFENGNSTNANNIRYYFHLCKFFLLFTDLKYIHIVALHYIN